MVGFEHFAEYGGDSGAFDIAREMAGVGKETKYSGRADGVFDVSDSAPLDAEADDRLENSVVSSAIDGELAPVVIGKEVHEPVVFFCGTLRVLISELVEKEALDVGGLRSNVRSRGRRRGARLDVLGIANRDILCTGEIDILCCKDLVSATQVIVFNVRTVEFLNDWSLRFFFVFHTFMH